MIQNEGSVKHKLLLDKVKYPSKPQGNEIGEITKRIIECPVEITIQELAEAASSGRTWVASLCKDKKKDINFISSSVLALDFDSGITLDEVLERLKQHGLDCTFAYSTFSTKPELPKFRVVFQLGKVIDKLAERRNIQLAVMALFDEVDPAPKAPSSLFFGGKSIIYPNYKYFLDLENDFIQTQLLEQQAKISKRIKGAIEKASKVKNDGDISNTLQRYDKKCQKNDDLYNIYTEGIGNLTLSDAPKELIQVDFDALINEIQILDDLVKGKWLTYPEYFGLATNLVPIKGGATLYKESLDRMVEIHQEEIEFQQALLENPNFLAKLYRLPSVIKYYVKYYDYRPTNLENFSRYKNDGYYINLIIASKKKRPIRLHEHETITIREARQELKRYFDYAIQSTDKKVYVLKVATGLGKSELCKNLINFLLAYPNHHLKAEMSERMEITHKTTPKDDELPTEIKDKLDKFYIIGAYSQAPKYLDEQSKNNEQVNEYLKQLQDCYQSTETVLTTHSKAIFRKWKHDTIVIDEDIVSSLLPTDFVKLEELTQLELIIKNTKDKENLAKFIESINNGKANTPKIFDLRFEDFRTIEHELLNNNIYTSNILQFFNSKFYVTETQDKSKSKIHFISRLELPKDKKIIILSATANESIYRALLGQRLEFYDVSNVEPDGLIIQDTKYSFSRSSLDEEKHLEYVANILKRNQLPTITFTRHKQPLKTLGVNVVDEMHFGKTTGFDGLKGQDIAIVGTPHVNPITISLYSLLRKHIIQ